MFVEVPKDTLNYARLSILISIGFVYSVEICTQSDVISTCKIQHYRATFDDI